MKEKTLVAGILKDSDETWYYYFGNKKHPNSFGRFFHLYDAIRVLEDHLKMAIEQFGKDWNVSIIRDNYSII